MIILKGKRWCLVISAHVLFFFYKVLWSFEIFPVVCKADLKASTAVNIHTYSQSNVLKWRTSAAAVSLMIKLWAWAFTQRSKFFYSYKNIYGVKNHGWRERNTTTNRHRWVHTRAPTQMHAHNLTSLSVSGHQTSMKASEFCAKLQSCPKPHGFIASVITRGNVVHVFLHYICLCVAALLTVVYSSHHIIQLR